jgi:hypothetical protein
VGYRRLLGALFVTALASAGCDLGPAHTLNATSLNTQISTQLGSRYPVGHVHVSCPSGIEEKPGREFSCSATLDGQSLTLDGTVTSSGGRYSIQPAEAIVVSSQAASSLQQQIGAQLHQTVSVDCGQPPVRVIPPGGQFTCGAVMEGTGSRQVTVTVIDAAGHTRFTLNT